METYKSRPLWLGEENEKFIIRSVEAIVIPELGIDPPVIDLMVRSDEPDASLTFEDPVGGLCNPSGSHVYLLRHLPPLFLARATAHELKHAAQAQKRLNQTRAQRERDSEIFELEFMHKIGWPSESNLIRCLSNAVEDIRRIDQPRMEQLRSKLAWEQDLLNDLKRQVAPSKFQIDNLASSIGKTKSELQKIEGQLART